MVVLTKHDAALWEKTNRNVSQIYNFSTIEHAEILAPLQNKKVISVGRLEFEKGYDLLIDAWKIVHKVNNEWILEIFGYGSLFEELAMKIKNEKKRIFFQILSFQPVLPEKLKVFIQILL